MKGYVKVFSQDINGGAFQSLKAALYKNSNNQNALLFSNLINLEDYRSYDGKFHFKLCYPTVEGLQGKHCNMWSQSSNPVEQSEITGFKAYSLAFSMTANGPWKGLGKSKKRDLLMSDFPSRDSDNMGGIGLVGASSGKYEKLPSVWAGKGVVRKVELYVIPKGSCQKKVTTIF